VRQAVLERRLLPLPRALRASLALRFASRAEIVSLEPSGLVIVTGPERARW
jgi:hypothetical protein